MHDPKIVREHKNAVVISIEKKQLYRARTDFRVVLEAQL